MNETTEQEIPELHKASFRWLQLYTDIFRTLNKMIRILLITAFHLFISISFYGQSSKSNQGKVLTIDSVFKTTINNGDTLSIKVRNLTSHDRGFTIEAVSMNKEPYYYNAVYSAFLNNDTLFFEKLRTTKRHSREEKTQYVLPNYDTNPFDIKANSDTTIQFVLKGTPIQKAISLKLKITTDIIDDEYETIYSDPFQVFALPD